VRDWAVPLSFAGQVYGRIYFGFFRNWVKKALALFSASLRRVVASGLAPRAKAEKTL
jgi:hypothetical protein